MSERRHVPVSWIEMIQGILSQVRAQSSEDQQKLMEAYDELEDMRRERDDA